MIPRIEALHAKRLVGLSQEMSLVNNTTQELWREFMSRRKDVVGAVGVALYSVQLYPENYFAPFDPARRFRKFAGVEVDELTIPPGGMEVLDIPGGSYAVFIHRGGPARARETFGYIFSTWLPTSGYVLDHRPHFELLGDKYKHNDPESEEEIWIPVRSS